MCLGDSGTLGEWEKKKRTMICMLLPIMAYFPKKHMLILLTFQHFKNAHIASMIEHEALGLNPST